MVGIPDRMALDQDTEIVAPDRISEGDVIQDQLGRRWLQVREVAVDSAGDGGMYSFYGEGPEDRMTFEGTESVRRRKR